MGKRIAKGKRRPRPKARQASTRKSPRNLQREPENDGVCHLLKLPTEIRDMIWAYAVAAPKAITPRQIATRSNLFVHGDHKYRMVRTGSYGTCYEYTSKEPPLVVTSLMETCRLIYDDLKSLGTFYKVSAINHTAPNRRDTRHSNTCSSGQHLHVS